MKMFRQKIFKTEFLVIAMIKEMNKKAQIMGLSFQAIFSIILIIVFISAAGIVARVLIRNVEHGRIVTFEQELKSGVEGMWSATSAKKTLTLDLPSKIKYVCFSNSIADAKQEDFPNADVYEEIMFFSDEDADLFFYKPDVLEGYDMNPFMSVLCGTSKKECLEIQETCCIENINGITMILEKQIGNPNVMLSSDKCAK